MWKILVIDDDFGTRMLLREFLKDFANCVGMAHGAEGIEAYKLSVNENKSFDAILLDINMPQVGGMSVLKKIRAWEASKGIELGEGVPIIMVTGKKESVVDAFKFGCDDYIVKPINKADLIHKLSNVMD